MLLDLTLYSWICAAVEIHKVESVLHWLTWETAISGARFHVQTHHVWNSGGKVFYTVSPLMDPCLANTLRLHAGTLWMFVVVSIDVSLIKSVFQRAPVASWEGKLSYNKTEAWLVSLKPGRDVRETAPRGDNCVCVIMARMCCKCVGPSCTSGYCCHSVKGSVSPHYLHYCGATQLQPLVILPMMQHVLLSQKHWMALYIQLSLGVIIHNLWF